MERNALRAGLVRKAEAWRWSSLCARSSDGNLICIDPWPEARPARSVWLPYVNGVETEAELTALRQSVMRGAPYGEES